MRPPSQEGDSSSRDAGSIAIRNQPNQNGPRMGPPPKKESDLMEHWGALRMFLNKSTKSEEHATKSDIQMQQEELIQ